MEKSKESLPVLITEVQELITYHLKGQQDLSINEGITPEREQIIEMLTGLQETIAGFSEISEKIKEQEERDKNLLMNSRLFTSCPFCEEEKPVIILREEKQETEGWMCDVVVCQSCHNEFVNPMPNNWNDRFRFFDSIIQTMEKTREDGTSLMENFQAEDLVASMKKTTARFRKAFEQERKRYEILKIAEAKAIQSLVKIRDFLLLEKINGMTWQPPETFVE